MNDMDESIRRALAVNETIRRQTEPWTARPKALHQNSDLRRLMETINTNREMIRAALGPFEELRRTGILGLSVQRDIAEMSRRVAEYQAQFRLPEMHEISNLFNQIKQSGALSVALRSQELWKEQGAELQRAMEVMRQPWLDIQNAARSFSGFAELQGIGYALRMQPPFAQGATEQLRTVLGDWQAPLSISRATLLDPLARTEYYLARGLDPALTAFPATAFVESTAIAGLRSTPPPLAEAYNTGRAETAPDDGEESFTRTNAAHSRLLRFETQLRRFIDDRMTAAFGAEWIRQRVPGSIWQAWDAKRQKARDDGEPEWPLIAYADFTDYVTIITRRDNWNAVFAPVFHRQVSVQESFRRLFPIRLCTMHARLITQEDELYLLVETMRLLKAMGLG